MKGKIVIRSSPVTTTSSSSSTSTKLHKRSKSNVGEVAGGTTANICVVFFCCPCVPMEFLILAVYKAPASVVRRIKKRNKKKRFLVDQVKEANKVNGGRVCDQVVGYADELPDIDLKEFEMVKVSVDGSTDAIELDKQMWDRFREAGFWRSPSQKRI